MAKESPDLTERQKRECVRNMVASVQTAYQTRQIAYESFMGALNDAMPKPSEIERHRVRVIDSTEAHLDNLIALRTFLHTNGMDKMLQQGPDDN
jgi:signal transduction histidine kinase